MAVEQRQKETYEWLFASVELEDEQLIRELQDELFSNGLPQTKYSEKQPHITIMPPFKASKQQRHELYKYLDSTCLRGSTAQINGAGVWPNIENPRVILLDVELSCDIEEIRTHIREKVGDDNLRYEPPDTHITLAKSEQQMINSSTIQNIVQKYIKENRDVWHTRVSSFTLTDVI